MHYSVGRGLTFLFRRFGYSIYLVYIIGASDYTVTNCWSDNVVIKTANYYNAGFLYFSGMQNSKIVNNTVTNWRLLDGYVDFRGFDIWRVASLPAANQRALRAKNVPFAHYRL